MFSCWSCREKLHSTLLPTQTQTFFTTNNMASLTSLSLLLNFCCTLSLPLFTEWTYYGNASVLSKFIPHRPLTHYDYGIRYNGTYHQILPIQMTTWDNTAPRITTILDYPIGILFFLHVCGFFYDPNLFQKRKNMKKTKI